MHQIAEKGNAEAGARIRCSHPLSRRQASRIVGKKRSRARKRAHAHGRAVSRRALKHGGTEHAAKTVGDALSVVQLGDGEKAAADEAAEKVIAVRVGRKGRSAFGEGGRERPRPGMASGRLSACRTVLAGRF